jgi:asparagine synthase (glutamine-hydrolysing)
MSPDTLRASGRAAYLIARYPPVGPHLCKGTIMPALINVLRVSGKYLVDGCHAYSFGFDNIFEGDSQGYSLNCGWEFSEQNGLKVWSDRLGFLPLFIHQSGNRVIVSDDIVLLLAAAGDSCWDEPALSIFFRLGFFIGNDTPFQHVKVVPPATCMEWRG